MKTRAQNFGDSSARLHSRALCRLSGALPQPLGIVWKLISGHLAHTLHAKL